MLTLSLKRASKSGFIKKSLQKFYATAIEPVEKQSSEEYEKELKKYDRLTNIVKRTRTKKPQRAPFVKNLTIGVFDKEMLTFPEMELQEVKNVEQEVEALGKVLKQKHMVNVDSIGNKQFRQTLSDHRAIGLQCSQFLEGRECCPMELMRFLDTLSEHRLRDGLLYNEMFGVQILNLFASDELKKKYLYPTIKGEKLSAFALYEPKLLDFEKMGTKAEISVDLKYWTLNGVKTFVVNGVSADYYMVVATDKGNLNKEGNTDYTVFLVEKDSPGVSWKKLNHSRIEVAEISFDNVKVPNENLIGQVNKGEEILKLIIRDSRLSASSGCNAISRQMVNNFYRSYIEKSSVEPDLMLSDAVKSKIGEIATSLYAAESVVYFTAGLQDWYENQDTDIECAIAKVVASEAAYNISSVCLDMLGQEASLKDHWARKTHEEVLDYLTLYETNESQRFFIALNGLQFAGVNIAKMVKKLRNPFFNLSFMMKRFFIHHRQEQDDPKLDLELFDHLHPSCNNASKQLEYCVKRLQFVIELLLTRSGFEIVSKHAELRLLADIMIECYTMTAVLGRASRSYCCGFQFSDYEVFMAATYCNLAVERVKEKVRNLYFLPATIDTENYIAVGKRLIESKGYFACPPITRSF